MRSVDASSPRETVVDLPNRRATVRLGEAIARALLPGDLILLDGDLGAGKTFLSRAILRSVGVPAHVRVTSPTFTLMNEYDAAVGARIPMVHADAYRLLDASGTADRDEIEELGLRARLADGWACIVEWGGGLAETLGGDALHLRLQAGRHGMLASARRLEATAFGDASHALWARTRALLAAQRRTRA